MFSLTVYLTALLYIGSQFAVLKLKNGYLLSVDFLCAPEYGELSLFSGTEIFSLVCIVTLKKSVLFHGINKRGSREDGKIEKHLNGKNKNKLIMKNIQKYKLQLVPFVSLLCPLQLYVTNVSFDLRMSK